jgi:hypothetical protein
LILVKLYIHTTNLREDLLSENDDDFLAGLQRFLSKPEGGSIERSNR